MSVSMLVTILVALSVSGTVEAATQDRPVSIAILPLENSSGLERLDPLREGIADLLIADLAVGEGVMVVDREALRTLIKEQRISMRGLVNKETQIRVGRLVGASVTLAGGFSLVDSTLRINAHLLDVETTELIKSEEVKGKVTDIVQLSRELALKLLKDLNINIESIAELDVDKSPEVNLHFIRGLGYYYGCMYDHAIMEFMNTLNLDPMHDDARFWNANSYFTQKEWAHARIELDRFLEQFPDHVKAQEAQKMSKTCWRNMKDWERELFGSIKRKEDQ